MGGESVTTLPPWPPSEFLKCYCAVLYDGTYEINKENQEYIFPTDTPTEFKLRIQLLISSGEGIGEEAEREGGS